MALIAAETAGKTLDEVTRDFENAVKQKGFGVLMVHNMKETMAKKGVAFGPECRIYEICNAQQAKNVLENDLSLSVMLPCRVSIYQEGPKVKLVSLRPTAMVEQLGKSAIKPVAAEVERLIEEMMQDAVLKKNR